MTHPGPTHPGPTGPSQPGSPRGHLPIGFDSARSPRLGELIQEARAHGAEMIAVLAQQYDPASGPGPDWDPVGPAWVDRRLGNAVANVRYALADLAQVANAALPPAGSAVPVMFPARQDPTVATTGEPVDHPQPPAGVRPTPGSAAALSGAVSESTGDRQFPAAGDSFQPCAAPTPDGPCNRHVGHVVGPFYPGHNGHMVQRHEPDRPGAPGLPPRPLNPRPPAGEVAACQCHFCRGFESSW